MPFYPLPNKIFSTPLHTKFILWGGGGLLPKFISLPFLDSSSFHQLPAAPPVCSLFERRCTFNPGPAHAPCIFLSVHTKFVYNVCAYNVCFCIQRPGDLRRSLCNLNPSNSKSKRCCRPQHAWSQARCRRRGAARHHPLLPSATTASGGEVPAVLPGPSLYLLRPVPPQEPWALSAGCRVFGAPFPGPSHLLGGLALLLKPAGLPANTRGRRLAA